MERSDKKLTKKTKLINLPKKEIKFWIIPLGTWIKDEKKHTLKFIVETCSHVYLILQEMKLKKK